MYGQPKTTLSMLNGFYKFVKLDIFDQLVSDLRKLTCSMEVRGNFCCTGGFDFSDKDEPEMLF